jgi:hypothetical protein
MTLRTTRLLPFAVITVVLAGLIGLPGGASAAPGTPQNTMFLSADRLFGLSVGSTTTAVPGGETTVDQTHFGFFLPPPGLAFNVYMTPRVAFDVAIIDGLTLGAAVGFVISDYDRSDADGDNAGGVSGNTLLLAPRAGYVLGLTPTLGLWLRGGLTYFRTALENEPPSGNPGSTDSSWGFAVNFEPTLLVTPFPHVGFTVSLLADIPLAGKRTLETTIGSVTNSTSFDQDVRNFGIVAGIAAIF